MNLERQITLEQKENVTQSRTEKTTAIVEEIIEETTELEIIETERVNENPNYIGRFWCTSYCPCAICCGHYAYNRPTADHHGTYSSRCDPHPGFDAIL